MKFSPLLLLLVFVGLAGHSIGCGGESGTSSTSASKTSNSGSIDSGIEGVPVPAAAEPTKGLDPSEIGTAWEALTMSFDETKSWYEERMPFGQDFKAWRWCDDTSGNVGSTGFARTYSNGPRQRLEVTIADNSWDGFDAVPTILIGIRPGGPC